ncbi:2460_t:CDS:2 [Scutellospora calospora]|uniref:2460_t:CDS:1 n=1 Tax=Scutellospora calospora TaxID=85575 RepID=A0ACA9K7X5_9GLOM|nr:2460_t:CDS:2 [Scutellospora calospora]
MNKVPYESFKSNEELKKTEIEVLVSEEEAYAISAILRFEIKQKDTTFNCIQNKEVYQQDPDVKINKRKEIVSKKSSNSEKRNVIEKNMKTNPTSLHEIKNKAETVEKRKFELVNKSPNEIKNDISSELEEKKLVPTNQSLIEIDGEKF